MSILGIANPSDAIPSHWSHEFDYKNTFPNLRVLRVDCPGPETDILILLPSSLTVLGLRSGFAPHSILRCLNNDSTLLYYTTDPPDVTTYLLPGSSSAAVCAFLSLAVLEVAHTDCREPPPMRFLPSGLLHFAWTRNPTSWHDSDYYGYDARTAEDSTLDCNDALRGDGVTAGTTEMSDLGPAACLRSLCFDHALPSVKDWLQDCHALTSLRFVNLNEYKYDAEDLPPLPPSLKTLRLKTRWNNVVELLSKDTESDISLTSLSCSITTAPDSLDLIAALFKPLKHLSVRSNMPKLTTLLPTTLTSLNLLGGRLLSNEVLIRSLPPRLIHLKLDYYLDIGLLPLLPRTLRHLSIGLSEESKIGYLHLRRPDGSLPADGLPYDRILPATKVLFGLPPNLISLNVYCRWNETIEFQDFLGPFLPQFLRLFTANPGVRIVLGSPLKSLTSTVGSWFGLSEHGKTEDELVADLIHSFPPGCVCNLEIAFKGVLGTKSVSPEVLIKFKHPELGLHYHHDFYAEDL